MKLENKVAIVTGGSRGIGYATVEKFIKEGAKVCLTASSEASAEKAVGKLKEAYPNADIMGIAPTLSSLESVQAEFAKVVEKYGRIDILINNAGVGYYGLHEELNAAKIKEIVRTNFEAPMILSQLVLRQLKKSKGFIINISSVTALQPSPHGCAYGASKAGLTAFSRSLFDEARKYGVKVVSVHPDMTSTDLYRNADFKEDEDMAAHLEPQEVAQTVEYIINIRDGAVVQEITIKPQFHRIRRK